MISSQLPIQSDRWEIESELGTGTFSIVVKGTSYAAKHRASGKVAAIKCGKSDAGKSLIKHEAEVLSHLQPCEHVPRLVDVGEAHNHSYIAMEVMGKTLETLRKEQKFSNITVAMIGIQAVTAFEALHRMEFVHRDVKPDNLTVGTREGDAKLYLIDFGAATRFISSGFHLRYSEDAAFVGNKPFCSLNVLNGIRPTRRDDLESVGYVLVYLFERHLPWMKIGSDDEQTSTRHTERKIDLPTSVLCKGLENEYKQFIDYCRALRFDEHPDYEFLKGLLRSVASRHGFAGEWVYDWVHKPVIHRPRRAKPRDRRCSAIDIPASNLIEPNLCIDQQADSDQLGFKSEHMKSPLENRQSDQGKQDSQMSFLGRSRSRKEKIVIIPALSQGPDSQPETPLIKVPLDIKSIRMRLREAIS